MFKTMLRAKLHRARVTHTELEYEGSCAIDGLLLDAAGIQEFEQIQIYNVDNGERFTTYAIRAPKDSCAISLNGAAAHKATPGDYIIICVYSMLSEQELVNFRPTLIYLDQQNRIKSQDHSISPVQFA